jgi:hypothetical protein
MDAWVSRANNADFAERSLNEGRPHALQCVLATAART